MTVVRLVRKPRHGFDGESPEFQPIRDLEGKGKRDVTGILNVNSDRLGYLEAHGRINRTHLAAGRKLQDAHEVSGSLRCSKSKEEPGGGSYSGDVMSVAAQMAGKRLKAALDYLGDDGAAIVQLVAIGGSDGQGISLAKAESVMRLPVGGGIGALRVALGALARHYGLT